MIYNAWRTGLGRNKCDDTQWQLNIWQPWKNLKTTQTVTTNIKGLQQTTRRERDWFLNHKDFAEVLADRNVLRLTETIQVSSNKNFLSITFKSKEWANTTRPTPARNKNTSNTITQNKFYRYWLSHKCNQNWKRTITIISNILLPGKIWSVW